ncbi:MAG: nucleotidyl transferase AbiEii/AbiGii toxin family protein [Paludibacter sp.]|nr:nucleotidyl transferase AbiEii/AbiGii toxin family protein [Paludibacter sp.]
MDLFEMAAKEAKGNQALVHTIVKEILHYEIMEALYKSKSVGSLVFQGGTALRLCHGGNRYSEDLDFASNDKFTPDLMNEFRKIFVDSILNKYSLSATVEEPSRQEPEQGTRVFVQKWSAKVEIPARGQKQPKINIEIADIPSYKHELKMIQSNYSGIKTFAAVNVETLEEILADKIIAVAGRPYFKARDFWDIKWLTDQRVKLNADLVALKIKDYGIDSFEEKIHSRLLSLQEKETQALFKKEMVRFLDPEQMRFVEMPMAIESIFSAAEQACNRVIEDFHRLSQKNDFFKEVNSKKSVTTGLKR